MLNAYHYHYYPGGYDSNLNFFRLPKVAQASLFLKTICKILASILLALLSVYYIILLLKYFEDDLHLRMKNIPKLSNINHSLNSIMVTTLCLLLLLFPAVARIHHYIYYGLQFLEGVIILSLTNAIQYKR